MRKRKSQKLDYDWLNQMTRAGWQYQYAMVADTEGAPSLYVRIWQHNETGCILDERNSKDAAIIEAHKRAGTVPPPF